MKTVYLCYNRATRRALIAAQAPPRGARAAAAINITGTRSRSDRIRNKGALSPIVANIESRHCSSHCSGFRFSSLQVAQNSAQCPRCAAIKWRKHYLGSTDQALIRCVSFFILRWSWLIQVGNIPPVQQVYEKDIALNCLDVMCRRCSIGVGDKKSQIAGLIGSPESQGL
jgi:hypothetical protein